MVEKTTQTIGRYELIRSVGKGSQGAVYLARDPTLDRLVAVKLLSDSGSTLNRNTGDGAPLEARLSSKLKHPNIIPIFDAGFCDAGPYLVFEYVEGATLAELLKSRGPYSIKAAVPMMAAILKGIAAAHASEILHLDLSPRNVLLESGDTPRIMDFGLAQYVSAAHEAKGSATGTLRYMAPEHFLGKPLGPWTDVFALGSTFYELVSGAKAMEGTTLDEIRRHIISRDVDFSLLRNAAHGDAFCRFLAGALEKRSEGRYADGAMMSEAFELFLNEAGLAEEGGVDGSYHSTIEFLMRRMRHTGDFPTISRTLSDINRLAGDDSSASTNKLANVILRDFALTGKLLKLVNSAFYGSRATPVTSISQAVLFLGVEKVRMTANSLSFFGHMKGNSTILKDSMTKAFLSGLIARHLAQRQKIPEAEEVFICGMCQNLGENLVMFYFPDEFSSIRESRCNNDMDKSAAARGVLGVTYAELGVAVAKTWHLPQSIIESIRGVPPGAHSVPGTDMEKIRNTAVFANRLCDSFQEHEGDEIDRAILALLDWFKASAALTPENCREIVAAGLVKLKEYAPVFEIKVATSEYCRSVQSWLDRQQISRRAESPRPPSAARS